MKQALSHLLNDLLSAILFLTVYLTTANITAAPKFTTRPRNVSTLGLIPVAAMTPTILSSSHLLPVPIAPVKVAMRCS